MVTGMAHIKRATLEFFHGVGLALYEAYGLTECGIVCGNRPGQLRIGSVGKPFDPDSVSVDEHGEIIVTKEYPLARGYLDEPDEQRVFEGDQRVRTGDLGHFDSDGYLFIDGRKKELLVTSGGYKLHPELLEERIHGCPLVDRAAAVLSTNRSSVYAVVTLRAGHSATAQGEVERYVQSMNQRLPEASRIAKVILRPKPFSVEDGSLTRNLKLNRAAIASTLSD